MLCEETRTKQYLSYISFCPLRILYDSKFIKMATSLGTNSVVVTRVHCMSYQKEGRALGNHAYSNILKILPPKNENIQTKKFDILHISAQNIDCGNSLKLPQWGNSNAYPQSMFMSRNKKNNVYPCKSRSYDIKKGLRGSQLYRHVFVMVNMKSCVQRSIIHSHELNSLLTFRNVEIKKGQ